MKSYILQPNHVRGLGNILDNEDNIEGLYCRVQQQNTTVDFEEVIMKTYYMGTGSELTITFITDSFSILPNSTAHIDVMVTDEEDNPVSGIDLYIYEGDELIAQLETGNDGFGVGDELIGFDFISATSGRHVLKCVLPRQDTYLESVKEVVLNVYETTTLTLAVDPSEIDTLTDIVTLYGTLIGDGSFGIVGQVVKFYNGDDCLGEGVTDDNGVATLVVNVSTLNDVSSLLVDWYDSSYYTSGSGTNATAEGETVSLRAVGERWLNTEFTNEPSYKLEFDMILSKNNRQGFYIGPDPSSNSLNAGLHVVKDISYTMVEKYDSQGNITKIEERLSSSFFNTGTHHAEFIKDGDLGAVFIDDYLVCEVPEDIAFYNTVGLNCWGSGSISLSNFELGYGKADTIVTVSEMGNSNGMITVRGVVTDTSNNPIQGIRVTVVSPETGDEFQFTTNASGTVTFNVDDLGTDLPMTFIVHGNDDYDSSIMKYIYAGD